MVPSWILQLATIVGGVAAVIGLWERFARQRQKREDSPPVSRLPKPPLWKRWTVAVATLLPIPIIAALAITRAASTDISLEASLTGVGFELAREAPIIPEPLRLSELGASGLQQIETPIEWLDEVGHPVGVLKASMLQLMTGATDAEAAIYLDEVVLPDNSAVALEVAEGAGEYRLSLTQAGVEPGVSVEGNVEVVVPAVMVTAHDFEPARFRLRPATDWVVLDLVLHSDSASAPLFGLRARNLELYRVDRYRQGTTPQDRMVSTVLSGVLRFPHLRRSLRLEEGDELWIAGSDGELDLALAGGQIELRFDGVVSGLRTGTADLSRYIMPRRGEVWLARYALISVPLALLYLTALYAVFRWWRRWA
jgi:hypothetical protein